MKRVTINLSQRTAEALEAHAQATGDNMTDTINRSVNMYTWLTERLRGGAKVIVQSPSGEMREIQVF